VAVVSRSAQFRLRAQQRQNTKCSPLAVQGAGTRIHHPHAKHQRDFSRDSPRGKTSASMQTSSPLEFASDSSNPELTSMVDLHIFTCEYAEKCTRICLAARRRNVFRNRDKIVTLAGEGSSQGASQYAFWSTVARNFPSTPIRFLSDHGLNPYGIVYSTMLVLVAQMTFDPATRSYLHSSGHYCSSLSGSRWQDVGYPKPHLPPCLAEHELAA
jgi:hypothetical protein